MNLPVLPYLHEIDYPVVSDWWQQWHGIAMPEIMAKSNGHVVTSESGEPLSYLFYWPTVGSCVAIVGWPCASPNIGPKLRNEALNLNYTYTANWLKQSGYKLIFTWANAGPVHKRLVKLGYMVGDTGMDHFHKEL